MGFPSVEESHFVPPSPELKMVASYIHVYGGKTSPELVPPSWAETEIIIIINNFIQRQMAISTFTFEECHQGHLILCCYLQQ